MPCFRVREIGHENTRTHIEGGATPERASAAHHQLHRCLIAQMLSHQLAPKVAQHRIAHCNGIPHFMLCKNDSELTNESSLSSTALCAT